MRKNMEKEVIENPEEEQSMAVSELVRIIVEELGEEVREDFLEMDLAEAVGYSYTLLLENGIDPDEFWKEKGIAL